MQPDADLPDQTVLLDTSNHTMIELITSRDPELLAAVGRLIDELRGSAEVRLGWNSMIDAE